MGNRLKDLRTAQRMTQDEAAAAMGVSRGQYIKLERGERRLTGPYIEQAARGFGVQLSEVLEAGEDVTLPIVGRVGASTDGAVIQATDQGPFGEIQAPIGSRGAEVAVEVAGHSMGLYAPDGSMILYDDRRDPPHEDMLGQVCVVGLPDGRTLVKRLLRGSRRGLFDLESLVGDTMKDQRVEWAAMVLVVIHPAQARRLRLP